MRILRLFEDIFNHNQEHYRLAATLDGHRAPINTFSFNVNGSLLASGGDDETVRIWDMDRFTCRQTLLDPAKQWGQVTVVKFITSDLSGLGSEWLCFGTGRGQFLMYRRSRKAADYVECLSSRVFSTGDGVEAFAFDQFFQRIAMTSHYGKVKMFRFEKGDLVELWSDELLDAIPRAILFTDNGQEVSIYGMENGTVYNRDAETSNTKSSRVFKTPTGNVSVCPATASVILDNMRDGFDLYAPNRTAPIQSFKVRSTKKYVKGCVFGEGGKVVVCGSDHGKIYIFGVHDEFLNQELIHVNRGQMIQAVQTATTESYHLIISGASDGRYDIAVWRRPLRPRVRQSEKIDISGVLIFFNFVLLAIFVWASQDFWYSPMLNSIGLKTSSSVDKRSRPFLPKKDAKAEARIPTIDEIFRTLDEAALRKLLGVHSLDFSESDEQVGSFVPQPVPTLEMEEMPSYDAE